MAIDMNTVNAMLDPFRGMCADLQSKNLSGPDMDECASVLQEMEAMVSGASDLNTLSANLATSGLYQKFSDAYTRVMTAAAAQRTGAQPSDEELLANTLQAYEDAITTLRSTGDPQTQKAIPGIERVLELGRSGISYPVFLRRLEEEGLTDALQGGVVQRDGLEKDIAFAEQARNPVAVKKTQAILQAYDDLAAEAQFGVPDPFSFGLRRQRIDWEFEPDLILRRTLQWRWNKLTDHLIDWLDAHTAFAPHDERWAADDPATTQRNIKMTKECEPGRFRARERIVKESYGFDYPELDKLEFVANDLALGIVGWTDARLDLARATYAFCTPGAVAPPELVSRSEELRSRRADMGRSQPAPV